MKWVVNYAILGPYDYMDIFEAPDETVAAKVVMIIRDALGAVPARVPELKP